MTKRTTPRTAGENLSDYLSRRFDTLEDRVNESRERLVRVETKVDLLTGRDRRRAAGIAAVCAAIVSAAVGVLIGWLRP